jgi:hypothetical protein
MDALAAQHDRFPERGFYRGLIKADSRIDVKAEP